MEWGHLKEHADAVPLGTMEDFVERLQAALAMVDANIL
jgi:hypothetical protein